MVSGAVIDAAGFVPVLLAAAGILGGGVLLASRLVDCDPALRSRRSTEKGEAWA